MMSLVTIRYKMCISFIVITRKSVRSFKRVNEFLSSFLCPNNMRQIYTKFLHNIPLLNNINRKIPQTTAYANEIKHFFYMEHQTVQHKHYWMFSLKEYFSQCFPVRRSFLNAFKNINKTKKKREKNLIFIRIAKFSSA